MYFDKEEEIKNNAIFYAKKHKKSIAVENNQSFLFDGTFSNLDKAKQNIQRSLQKERFVQIIYVYQDPLLAWAFVRKREQKDGRVIPKEAFVNQYFLARENVNTLKKVFGEYIKVTIIVKNIDGTDVDYWEDVSVIDNHIPEKYNRNTLELMVASQ